MEFTFSTFGNAGILSLHGRLVKDHEVKLREALILSVQNADHVVITFNNVREVDVHCFAVLCAACRISGSMHKRLILTGFHNHELREAFSEMILVCGAGPGRHCFKNCLWK